MAYRSVLGNQFETEIDKVKDAAHLKFIHSECADIRSNPLKPTEPLVGNMEIPGLRYRRIVNTTPQYRIMFMTYECGFSTDSSIVTCEHSKCPVGTDDEFLDSVGTEFEKLKSALGFTSDELDVNQACEGLIKFAVFGTRELIGNLYKLRKKDFFKRYLKV